MKCPSHLGSSFSFPSTNDPLPMSTRNNDAQESGPLPHITPKILLLPFGQKGAFLVAQMIKNSPAMQETQVQSLGQDPLEKSMATHSSILAWRIPWTEEPFRLQSMGSQRFRPQLSN